MLKDGINPLPKDTPLVKHTSEVRIDLKQQLKNIATSNACDCAKAQIGIAEVYLVDAARYHHEDRRRDEAQRLEREAERVIDNIQETDKQCVATAEAARLAKIEAERQEAERLAKIEADRLAKIEVDRIAAEQAALAAVQVAVAPAPEVIPVQQVSFGTDALFKFNGGSSKDLTADGLLKLEDFVTKLNEVKNVERLLVEGHADRFGRDPYNEGLSSQRANTIAAFLVSKGVNAQMIQVQGYGESRPLVECAGKKSKKVIECLQPNRRVELKVFGTK
jgi:outer membrane protein OmpA-like peptidoglycan-associated protein